MDPAGPDTTALANVVDALKTALEVIEDNTEGEEPEEEEATVPENLTASATVPPGSLAARKTEPAGVTKGDLFKLLATAHREGGERQMLAALSDIVPANTPGTELPQYVGELWNGKAYERKIIPLFNHADLTSFEVKGWRWVTKPTVAPYTGNKTDVPSGAVLTEAVTINAERIAGAHDIDRKYRDFNDEAFFAAYFAAMTESYAKVSDAQVLADVVAAAKAVAAGAVPSGVSKGMAAIVDGALAVLAATDTAPSFALVATDLYRDVLLTRNDDTLGYLSAALGLEDGSLDSFRLIPSASVTAGKVLVGAKDAVTVHELGGGAPIRVEAQDIAKGGIDEGVFGYYAVNVHDADGLALVTTGA
ncbi:phage major capsid protein [Georgenia yuyongxinii]